MFCNKILLLLLSVARGVVPWYECPNFKEEKNRDNGSSDLPGMKQMRLVPITFYSNNWHKYKSCTVAIIWESTGKHSLWVSYNECGNREDDYASF